MSYKRIAIFALVASFIVAFFAFDLSHYFSLAYLKSQQDAVAAQVSAQPLLSAGFFFAAYVAVTALSLPGAAIMTLAAGAVFGLAKGVLLVSFASSIGATLAFWISRFLLRDWVQTRFGDRLKAINDGVRAEGGLYLFTLRLVPAFPFFVINLVMGLTPLPSWTFYWVSQVGMLAGTLVYVNAGTQLAKIESLSGILSPALVGSFALLGVFPFIAKKIVEYFPRAR